VVEEEYEIEKQIGVSQPKLKPKKQRLKQGQGTPVSSSEKTQRCSGDRKVAHNLNTLSYSGRR